MTRLEPGKSDGGAEEECSRRDIAGDSGINGMKGLGPAMETESIERVSVAPKARRASSLWSRVRSDFANGRGAGGLQAGKQDAGLDLRAGNRCGVVDGAERYAVDGEWARGRR